jgi:MoaA/NifB/PqqE/SkfB family radical SAM enzyme
MEIDPFCAGCGASEIAAACTNCFANIGIIKVHWECWSQCNLSCPFCYRTTGSPINTNEAHKLIRAVHTSGSKWLVFAGGDPSLRADLPGLIDFARQAGLKVEIQTNAHRLTEQFARSLEAADLVGLSIDGPTPEVHDAFRRRPGNFDRVIGLLNRLTEKGIPVLIRTVVARTNASRVGEIANVIEGRTNVLRWSLLEFSPVGEGHTNSEIFKLDEGIFERLAAEVAQGKLGHLLDIYTSEKKTGTYTLITPTGHVYGVGGVLHDGYYPVIGSILEDHLRDLALKLPFSRRNHMLRYGYLSASGN